MFNGNSADNLANRLEGLLRQYLNCHYLEFGVKANDNLLRYDWKSPINLALGHRYAASNNDPDVKNSITCFLGNELMGQHIEEIITRSEYYGFNSVDDAYVYINETITKLTKILFP